jgi:hypothetical protein
MASMNFKEFCEETNKVVLLPYGKNKTTYGTQYIFSLNIDPDSKNIESIPLHGLYFPNEKEIKYFCEQKNLIYSMYKAILLDNKDCLCRTFIGEFNEMLNIKFEKNPFEEVEEFLKREEKHMFTTNIPELTEIIGRAYEKTNLLESDIRIEALKINPKINVIDKFRSIQIGYTGRGCVGKGCIGKGYVGEGVIVDRNAKKNYFL